ncbi:hypothetical protein ACIGHB_30305 [Streptomyces sp. NPDC085460]|uniref:hypothetical protein n=1 Tax=Streptomyces sp. NPDC085460 TaxID=3365723 RepID=UPI0037D33E81
MQWAACRSNMFILNRVLDRDARSCEDHSLSSYGALVPLIAEYSTNARAYYGLVEVYDSDAYLGDDESLQRSRTQVVAGNGYHLYLQASQRDIEVQVTIRIWDTPQRPPRGTEGTTPVSLESETGQLVVSAPTSGSAGVMDLPRPGAYNGHAAWSGREATAAYYNTCIQRGAEEQWEAEQIGAAWRKCPTTEHYTLDLWFVRESEPEDDWDE